MYKVFIATLLFLLTGAKITLAQTQQELTLSVSPPLFDIQLEPAQETALPIRLKNSGDEQLSISITAQDFAYGNTQQENYFPLNLSQQPANITSWLGFSENQVSLEKDQVKTIIVTLKAPPEAPAGGYYGMVAFTTQELQATPGIGTAIRGQVNTLLLASMGEESSRIGKLNNLQTFFYNLQEKIPVSFEVHSLGTTHLIPILSVNLYDWLGDKVSEVTPKIHPILPNFGRRYQEQIPRTGLSPIYTIKISFTDQESEKVISKNIIDLRNVSLWLVNGLLVGYVIFYAGRLSLSARTKDQS